MKKRIAFVLIALALLLLGSCELFEDPPTRDMVTTVTRKVLWHLKELRDQKYQEFTGVGAVINRSSTPPGGSTNTLSVKITEYVPNNGGTEGHFKATATFTSWSGDGSNPYFELSGELNYTETLVTGYVSSFSGKLSLADVSDKNNTIDNIDFKITDRTGNGNATGTITADGTVFTWAGELLN